MVEKLYRLIRDFLFNAPDVSNMNLAEYLITNGVTFQKWIPVSERLPEEHGTFIVALYIRSRKRKYSDSATFDPVVKRWRTHLFWGKGMKITHWMPLPEPPKEDN